MKTYFIFLSLFFYVATANQSFSYSQCDNHCRSIGYQLKCCRNNSITKVAAENYDNFHCRYECEKDEHVDN